MNASIGFDRTLAVLLVLSCGAAAQESGGAREPWDVRELASPAGARSMAPSLASGADGRVFLTWIEAVEGGAQHALRFAELGEENWSEPREIARGAGWFVNWADVPALAVLADGTLAATYLEKSGESAYAYDARLVRSTDGGATWSKAVVLHEDRTSAEHGFVSLVALDASRFAAVWLDGRNAPAGHDGAEGEHAGAMTLRARTFSREGPLGAELELDARVCDCCPTAALALGDGRVLAAYRDRADDETRDVALVGFDPESKDEPRPLARDGWRIQGCPVNGPALAASGAKVGAAWFTLGADGVARVQAALSSDGGKRFAEPLLLSKDSCEGSVDAAWLVDGTLAVSWLERLGEGRAQWRLASIDAAGRVAAHGGLVPTALGRASGRARIAADGPGLVLAWTDAKSKRVLTARVRAVAGSAR